MYSFFLFSAETALPVHAPTVLSPEVSAVSVAGETSQPVPIPVNSVVREPHPRLGAEVPLPDTPIDVVALTPTPTHPSTLVHVPSPVAGAAVGVTNDWRKRPLFSKKDNSPGCTTPKRLCVDKKDKGKKRGCVGSDEKCVSVEKKKKM